MMDDAGTVPRKSRGDNRKKSKSKRETSTKLKPESRNESESDVIDNNSRPWADLPEELLDSISNNLSMTDFLRFGRVCESWRWFFSEYKHRFMASQSPLVFEIPMYDYDYDTPLSWYFSEKPIKIPSKYGANSSRFYGINSPITFKIKLPNPYLQHCLGISSGYLILKRDSFLVINPITGHQIKLTEIPYPHDRCTVNSAIFASVGSRRDYLLVALSKRHERLFIFRDNKWRNYSYSHKHWFIEDMIVFDGSIFFVNNYFDIGTFNLKTCDYMLLELKFSPFLNIMGTQFRLVASKEKLFVIDFIYPSSLQVYRVDISKSEWVKVENLGDEALFIDDKSCRLNNPTEWGGRSNCVYYLPSDSDACCVYALNGECLEVITLKKGWFSSQMLLWYFPHHICSIDHVKGDYFGDSV